MIIKHSVVCSDGLSFNNKSLGTCKRRNDFTVNIFFIYSIAFLNGTVKYRALDGIP